MQESKHKLIYLGNSDTNLIQIDIDHIYVTKKFKYCLME